MTSSDLKQIYISRPFKTRNADEYDLENILDLFVDPTDGLVGPFDFTNSIIKGKMGSGKTMYLRANYAYYLYTLVPCLLGQNEIILPVYIRLSDFQNIHEPEKIYYAIIIKIIQEIVSVCDHLKSADELTRLHNGAHTVYGLWSTDQKSTNILSMLKTLTAKEYVEHVENSYTVKGSIGNKFFSAYADYYNKNIIDIKKSDVPSFQNIIDACNKLLIPFNGKLLILFDEIGSTNKSFFKSSQDGDSYFETLMNQLRTLSYVRTKLAVYPYSYSDILKETRYGDNVLLECDVINSDVRYEAFLGKTVSLIEQYINKAMHAEYRAEDAFDISTQDQLLIEHLVNASEGNMRRLVCLLDSSMNEAFSKNQGNDVVHIEDVISALHKQGAEMESFYQDSEKEFLENLCKLCRSRYTNKFTFPNKSSSIGKFTSFSEEYNIINIRQAGAGRKGTIYNFDYAYCVYKDIPTHYVKGSEKIDKTRSRSIGEPIKRVAQLSDELIVQSSLPGKINGKIDNVFEEIEGGTIMGEDKKKYIFLKAYIIKQDRKRPYHVGSNLRFLPYVKKDGLWATEIELL